MNKHTRAVGGEIKGQSVNVSIKEEKSTSEFTLIRSDVMLCYQSWTVWESV